MQETNLRPIWSRLFSFNWKFGLLLILIICIPRFVWVLQANETGNYGPIGAIMFVSALVPFFFLSRYGRKQIGITGSKKVGRLALAFLAGLAFSLLLYVIGYELFGTSYQNWYVYIGKSYNLPEVMTDDARLTMFLIMATTGMIFSPIGEELLFRGIIHGSFAQSVGDKKASLVDSTAFALTHIAHFGLVYIQGSWQFYPLAALIWMMGMFAASLLFFQAKKATQSLLGAILCHAGFNLGMIYAIFYLL